MSAKARPRPVIVQPEDPSYRIVALTNGHVALVDTADYDLVMAYPWSACKSRGLLYATSNIKLPDGRRTRLKMHRLILGLDYGNPIEGDHIRPQDTLDNRRTNLRRADQHQSACNRRKFKNNTSGYKGISFHIRVGKYAAGIRVHGKRLHLGYRDTAKEAYEQLYLPALAVHHGEFARAA